MSGALAKVAAIARANLVRTGRDRAGLFFIFALPTLIILLLGLQFGGSSAARIGVVAAEGPLADRLVAAIEGAAGRVELRRFADEAAVGDAVARGFVEIGVVVPADFDQAIAGGRIGEIRFVTTATDLGSALRASIEAAIEDQAIELAAARFAAGENGILFEEALENARQARAGYPGVAVATTVAGTALFPSTLGRFALGAQGMLVLFMFVTSMTAAAQLILSRQLGVSRRMFATPTGVPTIIVGETLGRWTVAMVQGLFIVFVSAVAFGVAWGDPVAMAALVLLFALVGAGAAMLVGTLATNADQASSIGLILALTLGAIGGAMIPPETFPDTMRTVRLVTPHAWMIDGLRAVGLESGGIAAVLPQLAVLALFAAVLLGLATIRFRRAITG